MEEDLVTYQIALKLKEKGFPQKTFGQYNMQSACYIEDGRFYENGCITEVSRSYTAPRISEVLKWLREEKQISVEKNVGMHPYKRDVCWYCTIVRFSESGVRENLDNFGETCDVFDSYEQAVLTGIEYVLDNLI